MVQSYRNRVRYLQGEVQRAVSFPDQLRTGARLLRLMGQQVDVHLDTVDLLYRTADRIEELERPGG